MTPTSYDNGGIKKTIDACYKETCQQQDVVPFVINSSEERFMENLTFFQSMASEIVSKKKSKARSIRSARNQDIKLEDVR